MKISGIRVIAWVSTLLAACGANSGIGTENLSPEGANCVKSSDCVPGLFCFSNVCAKEPTDTAVGNDLSGADDADATNSPTDAVTDDIPTLSDAPADGVPDDTQVGTDAALTDGGKDVAPPDVTAEVDSAAEVDGGADVVSPECGKSGAPMLQDTFGGQGDWFYGALPAANGGWLFYGTTYSKGDTYGDGWIVRTDASLGFLWEKTFGGKGDMDKFVAGVEHADGTFTLAGNLNYGSKGWVVHVDATGKQLWEFADGSTLGSCNGIAAVAVNDQGVAVAGSYGQGGGNSCSPRGWVLQFDLTGGQLWEAKPTDADGFKGIGGLGTAVVVAGTSSTWGGSSYTTNGVAVTKLKAGGQVSWSTSFWGQATAINALTVLGNGNIAIAGRQGNLPTSPQFRAALDPSGAILWQKGVLGTSGTPSGLAEAANGLVSSTQDGSGLPQLVAVSKTDGSLLWTKEIAWAGGGTFQVPGIRAVGAGLAITGVKAGIGAWGALLGPDGSLGCECTDKCSDAKECTDDVCTLGKCLSSKSTGGTACKTATNVGTCDASGTCKTLCANNTCDYGETYANCPVDCPPTCGNGTCDASEAGTGCLTDCVVGAPTFCDLHCGAKGNGCYCDSQCTKNGDCCNAAGNQQAGTKCASSVCGYCK